MSKRCYGYRPDLGDHRDHKLSLSPISLPESVDLRPQMPLPPFDQGNLSSCVAHACSGAIVFSQQKNGQPVVMPSRLYLYYFTRYIESGLFGKITDDGCQIRDAFKAANKWGECSESLWPYDESNVNVRPPQLDVKSAKAHKPIEYMSVKQDVASIKTALASGYPVIFGISVFDSFESDEVAHTGIVPMPKASESKIGGHAILAVGYTSDGQLIARNSWGVNWGLQGHFLLNLNDYAANPDFADDFWVLEKCV